MIALILVLLITFQVIGSNSMMINSSMVKVNRKILSRNIFSGFNPVMDNQSANRVPMYWYDSVSSTMDRAKDIAKDTKAEGRSVFAVVANHQYKGRGTRGRVWTSGQSNMFLTVAIKQSLLPIPLNYIPLRIGTIIASAIDTRVTSHASTKLKWPNDVLINNEKVCGVLIEIEDGTLFVGIGCNVLSAPEVPPEGLNGGRPATCLAKHSQQMQQYINDSLHHATVAVSTDGNSQVDINVDSEPVKSEGLLNAEQLLREGDFHKDLAIELCAAINDWVEAQNDTPESVITDFKDHMDFSNQKSRDSNNVASASAEEVTPLSLNSDGTLLVRSLVDGSTRSLMADYLWLSSRLLRPKYMGLGASKEMSTVKDTINSNSIVVFVSSGCPYCTDAVQSLRNNNRNPVVIEATGAQRSELRTMTGSGTVPVVFVKGKYVGGCNDGPEGWMGIKKIIKNNKLDELLSA